MKNVFQMLILHILFMNIFSSKLKRNIKIYTKVKNLKIRINDAINKEIASGNNNKTAINEENNPYEQNKNNTDKEEAKIEPVKEKYIYYRRSSSKWSTGAIIGIVVGGVVLIIAASVLALILRNRKTPSVQPVDDKAKTVVYLKTDGVINNDNNANNIKI